MREAASNRAPARAWTAVITATVLQIIAGGSVANTAGLLAVYWVHILGVSRGSILTAGTVALQLSGILGIFVGRSLAAKTPEYLLLVLGVVCGVVTFGLLAFASQLWQIILVFGVIGAFAIAFTSPLVGQSLAVRLFEKPGVPVSIVSLGLKGGAALMPPVLALLLEHFNLRDALASTALLIAVFAPLAIVFVRPVSPSERARPRTDRSVAAARGARLPTVQILADPAFIGLMLMTCVLLGLSAAIYMNMPLYVVDLGGKPADAAYIFSISTMASALLLPIVGWATDRIDLRLMLAAPVLLILLAVSLLSFNSSILIVMASVPCLTFANAVFLPCFPLVVKKRFGQVLFPQVLGLAQPFFYSSSLMGLAGGVLRDALASYMQTFQILALTLPLAILGHAVVARSLGHPRAIEASSTARV
jgi:MFS family permease